MALAGSILKDDFILELDELQFVSVERMGVHLFLHAFFALYTLHGPTGAIQRIHVQGFARQMANCIGPPGTQ